MTRIDLHESSKLTLVEGSAPSAPGSGLVRLYAKSDGLLYSKDDAGVETVVTGGGGGGSGFTVVDVDHVKLTGGNITCNQTSWGELASESGGPGTGALDLVLSGVATGDIIEVAMSLYAASAATYLYLDVATIVSSSPVNYVGAVTGAGTGDGVAAWVCVTGREETKGGSACYTLQSGDISAGSVRLRPWMRTSSATNRTLFGDTANPFHFSAKVYNP